jgi:hypothetical protein
MSEFKGTKGKWEVTPYQNVYCKINKICAIGDLGEITEEVKANALLISKAPEMLEMLKVVAEFSNCVNNDSGEGMIIDFQTFDEIIQLINEATQL